MLLIVFCCSPGPRVQRVFVTRVDALCALGYPRGRGTLQMQGSIKGHEATRSTEDRCSKNRVRSNQRVSIYERNKGPRAEGHKSRVKTREHRLGV